MAQHQTVVLVDDLDGSTAERTVTFSVDGHQYEIDLSRQNLQRLHDTLEPYLARARKVGPGPSADRQARPPRVDPPATAPEATSAPPAEENTTPPPIPVAVFSNPEDHVPAAAATAPRPHVAGLFSTAG